MYYGSTRGEAPTLSFDDVVLAGLARDGGLYVPATWPPLAGAALTALRDATYAEVAARVMAPFAAPCLDEAALHDIAADAYASFDHPDVAPLIPLGDNLFLLELFHGPTLAFKDYALQILGRLFERILAQRSERITIIGATSGDTGSAAIEACRDRDRIEIFILHPRGRTSEVQRRQMTTVAAGNVHNVAVEGTFDDCQALVKALFADAAFRDRMGLAAINSINWARIAAQVVYYARAALALGAPEREVDFAVPTGNFGNVFAGYVAKRIGVPIRRLIVGSNSNDILTRFFHSGRMEVTAVHPTLSPSMDIQVSSNFERLLFDLYDRDAAAVRSLMAGLRDTGKFTIDADRLEVARALFPAARFDDRETTATIRAVYRNRNIILDPHSAIGVAAARRCMEDASVPTIALATAHPAKFSDAVERAIGSRPPLPPALADLMDREEHYAILPAETDAIRDHIVRAHSEREVPA
ncbi:MAG: threonine synthase [Rhodospirillales bacterium]|nr:threonine synthase [Rhodospirillales bacterium]